LQIEVDLKGYGGEIPRHPHHAGRIDFGQKRELRFEHDDAGEIEVLTA